ncbi:flagellar hook-length control protein FliK [Thioclava atlantica]|uniref:Flagellar hook-length control protein n=1 Tax=Thioclava atlantica TaxID=1317124 RepID=A0A085TYA8_9RHOB|nr:flagellar hook-length control protein FliK [Thioclava atlantica]KFE35705.1 flagellar hook-length control protein [Thioclava atlantica]
MDAKAATLLNTTTPISGAGRKPAGSEQTGFGTLLQGAQTSSLAQGKGGAVLAVSAGGAAGATLLADIPALQTELVGKLQKVRDGALAELANGKPVGAVLSELGASLAKVLAGFDAAHGTKLREVLVRSLNGISPQAGSTVEKPASGKPGGASESIDEVFASLLMSLGLPGMAPERVPLQKGGAEVQSAAALLPARSTGETPPLAVHPKPEAAQAPAATPLPQGPADPAPNLPAAELRENGMDPRVRAVLEAATKGAGKTGKSDAQAAGLPVEPGKGDPKPGSLFAEAARAGALPDTAVARLTQHDGGATQRSEAVAQSGQPAAQPSPRFAAFLATQLRRADLHEGRTRVALTPRGLGDIEIDVERDKRGQINVVVRAESPAVLSALRGDRDTLANILAGQGIQMDSGTLDFEQFGGHGGQGEERSAGTGANFEDDVPVLGADWQPTILDGQVDIRT